MAIGFTPKHTEDYPLGHLTQEQFLVIAQEAVAKLAWQLAYISNAGLIAFTANSDAEIRIIADNGTASLKSTSTGNEMMDWGKNKKNIARFSATFNELKSAFTAEELAWKYEALQPHLVADEQDILKLPPATTKENISGFFSLFKPTEGYFITPILLNVNIIIFILMGISGVNILEPDSASLLKWGANFRPMTLEGQPWRLLTNCFLHIGILHLLMNMYALLFIGLLLEPYLGKLQFITAYLLTGIAASIVSLWWHDLTISAGASGAIFGMYGVFLAMLTTNLIEKRQRKTQLSSIGIFVGYNLLYGLTGNIDNAAHIGGLVSGLMIGYAFIPGLRKPDANNLKLATVGLLTILILASSAIVYKKLPNDIGRYDAQMKEIAANETLALEAFNLPKDAPKAAVLDAFKVKGIAYWNKNIALLDDLEKLNLPAEIDKRDKKLKAYCVLRLKTYELIAKSVEEDTDVYQGQIADYNRQIDAIINELSGGQNK